MRITIADVAARAGVSKTTVSRVLNAKDDLDARTAARVRQVIEELGYVPSSGAVGLARGKTRVVGVLVPSLQWPWMGDVIQGAVDTIEASSYGMLLFTCNRGDESMRKFASQVSAKSFDGLVVIEPEGTLDYIASLHAGRPSGGDDRRSGPAAAVPSVGTTNFDGGHAAAAHLIAIGRRRPVVIQGHRWLTCTTERLEGFASAFDEAGHLVDPGTWSWTENSPSRAAASPSSGCIADGAELRRGVRAQRPVGRRRDAVASPSRDPGARGRRGGRVRRHRVRHPHRSGPDHGASAALRDGLGRIHACCWSRSTAVHPAPMIIRPACGFRPPWRDHANSAGVGPPAARADPSIRAAYRASHSPRRGAAAVPHQRARAEVRDVISTPANGGNVRARCRGGPSPMGRS